MTAPTTETITIETVEPSDDDNPSRMLHLICPWCYPEVPPVGTPTVRWCGQVVTIKDDGILTLTTEETPADACSTCGALNTHHGIIRPQGHPS